MDTSGNPDCYEQKDHSMGTVGYFNKGEAHIIKNQVRKLVSSGLPQNKIKVIAYYRRQIDFIKKLLSKEFSDVEVGTVDGFQGSECEAILISIVRSNKRRNTGFLTDNRLNVAITRAKCHLFIVGNCDTICTTESMKMFVSYVKEINCLKRLAHPLGEVEGK